MGGGPTVTIGLHGEMSIRTDFSCPFTILSVFTVECRSKRISASLPRYHLCLYGEMSISASFSFSFTIPSVFTVRSYHLNLALWVKPFAKAPAPALPRHQLFGPHGTAIGTAAVGRIVATAVSRCPWISPNTIRYVLWTSPRVEDEDEDDTERRRRRGLVARLAWDQR